MVLLAAAVAAQSVALALVGFGLDSLIEILASLVVVWQLQDTDAAENEQRALQIVGVAFLLPAACISAQSIYVLAAAHPHHALAGIVWLALTAVAMSSSPPPSTEPAALSATVVQTEARVTLIDGRLAGGADSQRCS